VTYGSAKPGNDEEQGHRASEAEDDAAVREAHVPECLTKRVMQQHRSVRTFPRREGPRREQGYSRIIDSPGS